MLVKKRKAVVEDVARLRSELDEKEKELKELNDALEPSNGVQRSPSLNRLHSEEGENLAVTLVRMRGISETLEPAAGDGV